MARGVVALVVSLLAWMPGCLTAKVLDYAKVGVDAEAAARKGFCATGRVSIGNATFDLEATDLQCRLRPFGGDPPSVATFLAPVLSARAADLVGVNEQLIVAYAPERGGAATIAVVQSGGVHAFATREPDGRVCRTEVVGYERPRTIVPVDAPPLAVVIPLFVLACIGDAVIFSVAGVVILPYFVIPLIAGTPIFQ